jgi:hypothetical protein
MRARGKDPWGRARRALTSASPIADGRKGATNDTMESVATCPEKTALLSAASLRSPDGWLFCSLSSRREKRGARSREAVAQGTTKRWKAMSAQPTERFDRHAKTSPARNAAPPSAASE